MDRLQQLKEYFQGVWLGVKNFHFFRLSNFARLQRAFRPWEKKTLIVAVIIFIVGATNLVAASYLASTVEVPDYGGKYIEGLVGQPQFLNPALAVANEVDRDISKLVFSGLYKHDKNQQLVPDLAESMPEISADQKQYKIQLRHDVLWHDGQTFSADDVVYTLQLIQSSSYPSPLRANWSRVEVKKLDQYTITLTLKEPSAPFIHNLTDGILPKHLWENVESGNFTLAKYNLQPIGTGPFTVKGMKKTEDGQIRSIELEAFERYYAGRPYLDAVEFKFYRSYEDLIAAYHSKDILGLGYVPYDKKIYVEKSSHINLYNLNLPRYQAVFFNRGKSAVLADKNVRAALAQGLDRQAIIDEVYWKFARPAFGPIPEGYLGYNSNLEQSHAFNPENSKKLLVASGFVAQDGSSVLKKGEAELQITITTDDFPVNIKTAELLKRQWEAIGFRINLQILKPGELLQDYLHPRAYEALLYSENIGGDADPYAFWHSSQKNDPGLNLSLFSNKEADQLLVEARTNQDPGYRASRYLRFQELIVDDIPAVFIVNSLFVYGVSTKIHGLELSNIIDPSERFLDIAHWYLKTNRQAKK